MKIEICANSYASAKNAALAGADRVELCNELAVGGITPSYGMIKKVVEQLEIDIFVLIRPRSGHFTYSKEEFDIMKENVAMCKELGCHGIVSGVLHHDHTIDIKRTTELVALSAPLPFTFHRAFDWTPNPLHAIDELTDIGVKRILTSGQQQTAEKGMDLLVALKEKSKEGLIVMPGGGVNSRNAMLFKNNGFAELHASLTSKIQKDIKPKVPMNSPSHFGETHIKISDQDRISALINVLKPNK